MFKDPLKRREWKSEKVNLLRIKHELVKQQKLEGKIRREDLKRRCAFLYWHHQFSPNLIFLNFARQLLKMDHNDFGVAYYDRFLLKFHNSSDTHPRTSLHCSLGSLFDRDICTIQESLYISHFRKHQNPLRIRWYLLKTQNTKHKTGKEIFITFYQHERKKAILIYRHIECQSGESLCDSNTSGPSCSRVWCIIADTFWPLEHHIVA